METPVNTGCIWRTYKMEKYGPFYYYEVDSDHYFKIAHLNELLIGQDKAQIQGIWASHAKTLPVQLDNLYLCIGGLPRAIYRTFYGCNASRYMNIINAVKQEMASILHKHRCHGELFLFNYGQKQIVLLYSPSGGDTPDHHEIASQFSGQILAAYKKQLYEDQEQLQHRLRGQRNRHRADPLQRRQSKGHEHAGINRLDPNILPQKQKAQHQQTIAHNKRKITG